MCVVCASLYLYVEGGGGHIFKAYLEGCFSNNNCERMMSPAKKKEKIKLVFDHIVTTISDI